MAFMVKRYPFYIGITTLVVIIVFTLTGLFLWISQRESKAAAVLMADRLFTEINAKTMERYENALGAVAVLAGSAARMPSLAQQPTAEGLSHPGLNLMFEALDFYDYIFSTYIGYEDGSFVQLVALRDKPQLRSLYGAPQGTYYLLQTIFADPSASLKKRWYYLDQNQQLMGQSAVLEPDYDPRRRSWYSRAQSEAGAFFTEPYIFSSSKLPGITCAEKLTGNGGVFAADITLERLSLSLEKQKISANGMLFVFDPAGRIIAHPSQNPVKTIEGDRLSFITAAETNDPRVQAIVDAYQSDSANLRNQTREIIIDKTAFLTRSSGLRSELKFDQVLASIAPVSDFTAHIRRMQQRIFLFAAIVLMVVLPVVLLMSRKISGSLMRLEQESIKIQQFDFSESEPFDSAIKEIHAHIKAFVLMKTTIRDRTDALIATQKKLETLVKSGIALTAENDMDRLLKKIFASARYLARADGGSLYLRDETDHLQFAIMQKIDGQIVKPPSGDRTATYAPIPINTNDANASPRVESHVALTGRTVIVNGRDDAGAYDLSDSCFLADESGAHCSNLLTVPLRTREGKTIGILQMFNARDEKTGDLSDFSTEVTGFVEALAAQAAVALHNKRLLEEQRILFDAFIQLIAGAIDAKSPYTGGHCARVPEVAALLAKAAHETTEGPFRAFRMETEDQWREFNVAAWLHDCGKVTTPEYVVDKATKLETIYNRLHEIRMRFEVLLRDAEIDTLQRQLAGDGDAGALQVELVKNRKQIKADFAFVAACNIGGEFMADDKIKRLKRIAQRTWVRHLDDRIGISDDEAALKRQAPAPALPVVEQVLADKPEHIVRRTNPDPFDGNPYGFKMTVPKYLYNLGELYNLSIRKGTLSPEDRFKINEHIIQTIKMLKKLPFPEYLVQVAEFAGAHHETMIGTGYPRGLTKADMSTPARIMAIADIFEALTAADRPYKKPKALSQALRIMSLMRDEQHIDAELFDLFLTSGVYQTYAERFMDPAQIDSVDIRHYLSDPA